MSRRATRHYPQEGNSPYRPVWTVVIREKATATKDTLKSAVCVLHTQNRPLPRSAGKPRNHSVAYQIHIARKSCSFKLIHYLGYLFIVQTFASQVELRGLP